MSKIALTFSRAGSVALAMLVVGGLLAGCGSSAPKSPYPDKDRSDSAPRPASPKDDSLFGEDGLLGGSKKRADSDQSISVNAFLWRAALDTLAFMPIANADPFGGTIITDWYQVPEGPAVRFKLNVFILDRVLRADGIKVSVFKQAKDSNGQWIDIRIDPKMGPDIENSILTRARQLRIASTTAP